MDKNSLSKIYEWASYTLIVGATVYYFVSHHETAITLILLFLAVFVRNLMYRTRYKLFEAENEELRTDLRRLTNLLEVAKKSEKKQTEDK